MSPLGSPLAVPRKEKWQIDAFSAKKLDTRTAWGGLKPYARERSANACICFTAAMKIGQCIALTFLFAQTRCSSAFSPQFSLSLSRFSPHYPCREGGLAITLISSILSNLSRNLPKRGQIFRSIQ
jgi:hypothetical protein